MSWVPDPIRPYLSLVKLGLLVALLGASMLGGCRWQASRDGLRGSLLDPDRWVPRPADQVIGSLLTHLTPALRSNGDLDRVRRGIDRIFDHGTGADRQRAVAEDGHLPTMVQQMINHTVAR